MTLPSKRGQAQYKKTDNGLLYIGPRGHLDQQTNKFAHDAKAVRDLAVAAGMSSPLDLDAWFAQNLPTLRALQRQHASDEQRAREDFRQLLAQEGGLPVLSSLYHKAASDPASTPLQRLIAALLVHHPNMRRT